MKYIELALIFLIVGCGNHEYETYKNKPVDEVDLLINERLEAKHPNLKPMYGDKIKSEEENAADKKYIYEMIQLHHGDTIKAAKEAARDGWHYFYRQIIDTAMFRFNQSWLIDSNYPASYFGFAAIREYQGIIDQAEKYFKMGYQHDSSDSLTRKYLHEIAEIKEKNKDTLGLIKSYYRVLSHFPKDGVASGKLGFFFSAIHEPDSAFKYYNLTIAFDPEYDQTYINRGWYYFQHQKIKEAIIDYSTAIQKNSKSISAYVNRANALMFDKQYEKAVMDLKRCIVLDSDYPGFHGALAECYFQLNQNNKGCEELNVGTEKGGEFSNIKRQHNCE